MSDEAKTNVVLIVCFTLVLISVVVGITVYQCHTLYYPPPVTAIK